VSVDAVSGNKNQALSKPEEGDLLYKDGGGEGHPPSIALTERGEMEPWTPNTKTSNYFSEKSAAVVFENWNVFCFVKGDVRRPME